MVWGLTRWEEHRMALSRHWSSMDRPKQVYHVNILSLLANGSKHKKEIKTNSLLTYDIVTLYTINLPSNIICQHTGLFKLNLPPFLRVILVHVQMERTFPGKFLGWKPRCGVKVCAGPLCLRFHWEHTGSVLSHSSSLIRPTIWFALYHRVLSFWFFFSEVPFQNSHTDCGLSQWKLLILLLNSVRDEPGWIKMIHKPLDSIAQPCTVGHNRKSKLILWASWCRADIQLNKQYDHRIRTPLSLMYILWSKYGSVSIMNTMK